jgi:glycine/D-amino acid oxidase-like deaminating enzyme
MDKLTDVTVVGGGVVGCFIAYRLAATLPGRTPMLGPVHGLEGVYLAVPSSNGFLLSAVLAHILSELLVHGKPHPFLPMILPGRVLQSAVAR